MAVDKSKWDTKIRVSQKTIDEIKKMGMSKALKTVAGASAASGTDASAKEWAEGVKRLYGANRVASVTPSLGGSSQSRAANRVVPTSTPKSKPSAKSSGFRITPKEKAIAGTAAAVGALALSRGRAGSAAARLAPGLGKSTIGKALLGGPAKVYKAAPSTAKALKKVGTKSEIKQLGKDEATKKWLAEKAKSVSTKTTKTTKKAGKK